MNKQVERYCHKAIVMVIKEPLVVGEDTLDLKEIFDNSLGKRRWHQILKRQISNVRKKVSKDVRAGVADPMQSDNPFLFMVNSISIHVIERMLVKAEVGTLTELRENGYHDALHDEISSLDLKN